MELSDKRLKTIVQFALKINADGRSATEADIMRLREVGLTDRELVQLVHLVSDFASYNRLNLVLQMDYDYRDSWRRLAFGMQGHTKSPGLLADTTARNDSLDFFLLGSILSRPKRSNARRQNVRCPTRA